MAGVCMADVACRAESTVCHCTVIGDVNLCERAAQHNQYLAMLSLVMVLPYNSGLLVVVRLRSLLSIQACWSPSPWRCSNQPVHAHTCLGDM